MIATLVARTGAIDLNDSSVVKHTLGAAARELGDIYYQLVLLRDIYDIDTASGTDLDERAREIKPNILRRRGARRAVGTVVLTRPGTTGTTIIAPGVTVRTPEGVLVRTLAQATITASSPQQVTGHGVGRDSAPITAQAVSAGSAGNIAAGTATTLVQKPAGITEATNPTAFVLGRDRETDDEFRRRIRDFVGSLSVSTVDAIKYLVLGLVDPDTSKEVQFAHVFEDPVERGNVTLYVDDGAGTAEETEEITNEALTFGLAGPPANSAVGGEEYLYLDNIAVRKSDVLPDTGFTVTSSTRGALVEGTDYNVNPATGLIHFTTPLTNGETIEVDYIRYTGLIRHVQRVVTGDTDDRLNFPGLEAAGIRVLVRAPDILVVPVQGTLLVEEGYNRDDVIAAAESAVTAYMNSRGISGDIIRNEIIEAIMTVPGVRDLVLNAPSANVTVLDNQLVRVGSADVDLD